MTAPSPSLPRPGATFVELVDIMERLLAPDGCPWDREQTLETLRPFLVEETYEVLEAMERGTPAEHCDELGDLLMQIVFQAALRRREGSFAIDDVVAAINDKLVRRHPHVFADAQAETAEKVLAQWNDIKAEEKRQKAEEAAAAPRGPERALGEVPLALPALARAQKLSERAGRVGFDWPDAAGSLAKVKEEIGEVESAMAEGEAARFHEIGDLLFATVNLARKLGVDAEGALRAASGRFVGRFEYIEDRLHEGGRSAKESTLEEMDGLWDEAKRRERARGGSPGTGDIPASGSEEK
jgi:nucleoside triphosphate diphosphatase